MVEEKDMKKVMVSIIECLEPFKKATTVMERALIKLREPMEELAKNYAKFQQNLIQNMVIPMSKVVSKLAGMVCKIPYIELANELEKIDEAKKQEIRKDLTAFIETESIMQKDQDNKHLATQITNISIEITCGTQSVRKKKNLFQRFLGLLMKLFEFAVFPIVLFIIQPYYEQYINSIPEKTIIEQSFIEISQIKQLEEMECDYRVVNHNTNLYTSAKLTNVLQHLETGDILIVLEINGKLLKVQDYQTGNVGYIRKKYTEKR